MNAKRKLLRWTLRIVLIVLAILFAATIALWFWAQPATPDDFYSSSDPAPNDPGKIVKWEAFARDVPSDARAWRILYSTTDANAKPILASAIVVASQKPANGPRPIIAWNHGTTGFSPGCAPSVLAPPQPLGPVPSLEAILNEGWVLVATDYAGLGTSSPHPYLIGEGEARSTLDGIRAAREFPDLKLDNKVVIWGHSQGGHATLWSGLLAPSYAPELNIAGVAALAPASDVPSLVDKAKDTPVGKIIVSFLMNAYSQTYPDVKYDDYVSGWRRTFVKDMGTRCLDGKETLFSVAEVVTVLRGPVFDQDPSIGPLRARLTENIPNRPIASPILIAQGRTDELVLPEIQEKYVDERCSSGQVIEYQTYEGRDHMQVVAPESPLQANLVQWTRDRIAGSPTPSECIKKDF